jgi:2-iminobutanoate/2-iminopropanoate deaminase
MPLLIFQQPVADSAFEQFFWPSSSGLARRRQQSSLLFQTRRRRGVMTVRRIHNPSTIRAPFAAYSHGVSVEGSARILFASGQLGLSPDDIIPDDIEAQADLCFRNIAAILADAGMTFDDVVRFNGFVTDRAFFPIYSAVRARYVSGSHYASTLVIVTGFTRPEFKIEVEVTAVRSAQKDI